MAFSFLRVVAVLLFAVLLGAPRLALAGALTKFQRVTIARVAAEAEELVSIALDLSGTELGESYEVPGQYIQVRTSATEKAGFFAIASAPGAAGHWELLIKTGTPLTDKLSGLAAGSPVEITPAQGSGFPCAVHKGKDVVILAMGSGVSACRSLLDHILRNRSEFGAITLIAGGRTPAHLAYRDRAERWIAAGARVVFTISRPDTAAPWSGATGYVQDRLTREMLTAKPTALFAVGSKEMMMELATKLTELGAADVKPVTNF